MKHFWFIKNDSAWKLFIVKMSRFSWKPPIWFIFGAWACLSQPADLNKAATEIVRFFFNLKQILERSSYFRRRMMPARRRSIDPESPKITLFNFGLQLECRFAYRSFSVNSGCSFRGGGTAKIDKHGDAFCQVGNEFVDDSGLRVLGKDSRIIWKRILI